MMPNYLCIDIGGTSIKYGIYNETGDKVKNVHSDKTNNAIQEINILNTLCRKVEQVLKNLPLAGVCISSAGVVETVSGTISYSGYTIPNYTGTKLKEEIEKRFQLPCAVENDVNAACLGEYWKGALRGATSGVCLTVGTGIGGAVLVNGDIYHGFTGTAGEIGYMIQNGARFQDQAATSVLVRNVSKRKHLELDGQEIFKLAQAGDAVCMEEIAKFIHNLAIGIVNIQYLLNPEKIVLGGAIMAQEEYLKPKIEAEINSLIEDEVFNQTQLCFAELKNDAGMVGALYNFIKK
jgi:predicted NBD/HSP70 family sugar kinase